MTASLRDWQLHGVTIKVELATSGGLIVGGNKTDIPFNTGGTAGAPVGWRPGEYFNQEPVAGSEANYNFTTTGGLFSVSAKTVPTSRKEAGIWSNPTWVWPVTPGYRYQAGVQCRQMAGKAASERTLLMETSANSTGPWSYYIASTSAALTDFEDILITGGVVPAGRAFMRLMVFGSCPAGNLGLWGAQFQNLYIRQLDLAPPPLTWVDVTCDVKALGVRYGRERFTNRYDVSTMTLEMLNTDGKYSFHEPHELGLAPGRQVRVTATYKGVTYPMAFHVLDSLTDGYSMDGQVVSRWALVDPTSVLSNATVATNQAPYIKGGPRIGLLLDQVGYIPRQLDAGNFYMQNVVASGRSIRDEAGITADSEGGNFFADRVGQCVYKDRDWQAEDSNLNQVTADLVGYDHGGTAMPIVDDVPTQAGAPIICISELTTDWSLARVVNLVSLANAGGAVREYVNADSMKQYGPATYQRHDFVLLNDGNLDDRAADIMTGYADPVLRVNSVGFAPGLSGAPWEWTLGAFLNWLVRVWYSHPSNFWGYAVCVHIQSIEHRITPTDWVTVLSVDLPESFTELEWVTVNGWDAGLWDEVLWDQGNEKAGALWDEGFRWAPATTNVAKWGI